MVGISLWLVLGDDDGAGAPSGGCRCGGRGQFVEEGSAGGVARREDGGGEFEIALEPVGEGEEVADVVVAQDEASDSDRDGSLVDGRIGEELEVGGVYGGARGGGDLFWQFVEGREVEYPGPTASGVVGVACGAEVAGGHVGSACGLTGEIGGR